MLSLSLSLSMRACLWGVVVNSSRWMCWCLWWHDCSECCCLRVKCLRAGRSPSWAPSIKKGKCWIQEIIGWLLLVGWFIVSSPTCWKIWWLIGVWKRARFQTRSLASFRAEAPSEKSGLLFQPHCFNRAWLIADWNNHSSWFNQDQLGKWLNQPDGWNAVVSTVWSTS